MVEAIVGQLGKAKVVMRDADGRETDSYDEMIGIGYESSNPDAVSVVDDDAEPRDARLEFLAPTDEPVFIDVTFDGDPGDGMRPIRLRSDGITVVLPPPGDAVSGDVIVEFTQVDA